MLNPIGILPTKLSTNLINICNFTPLRKALDKSNKIINMRKFLTFAFLLLSLGITSQAQVTTSGINGRVKDSKDYLPGATIQAIHQPTGTRYGTVTNPDGRFTLQGMRPGGPYEIIISFLGYQTEKIENVQLRLGELYSIDVSLKNESLNLAEVIVKGRIGDDASKTGAATSFSRTQLEMMPTVSRSIADLTRLSPQATANSNGAISFAGANNRYNSFRIDGAMNNDVFGLTSNGTNGGQASVEPVSLETIEQVQINIAPFDVRQSGFTGGGINAITRSGTNAFHGSAYFFGNNQELTGKTPGTLKDGQKRERLVKQHDNQFGITVGGPVIKDKLFFYANYERTDKSYPTTYNLNDGSNITQEIADQIVDHMKTLTNGAYSGNFDKKDVYTRSNKAGLKLDWNINEQNKLTARYSYVGAQKLSFPRSASQLYASDAGFVSDSKTNSYILELNSQIKNSMNNELRASYVRVRDSRVPEGEPLPSITIKDGSDRSIILGTEYSSAANCLDQDIISLTDNFNWLIGNHSLTIGTHNELYFFENLFIQNSYGSYTFNSLAGFLDNKPDLYFYGQSADITGKKDYAPTFGALQLGFYIQDNWSVSNKFSLNYGVRMDIPMLLDRPTENQEFNNSEIAQQNDIRTDVKTKATPLWSPRIGFRWNPDNEQSHLIRGGVGIFTGRIPFVWLGNSFSNTGIEFIKYAYYNSGSIPAGVTFNMNPYTQYEMLQNATAATTEVNVFDKKFKFTQNLRFNLAYEYTFAFGMRGTLEGLYSKTLNDIVYKDLNIEATGKTVVSDFGLDFDTRPMFKNKINPAYTNIMYLGNTNKGYTYNVSAKLEKSFNFGLDASAAYTYGQSKSINPAASSVAFSNWRYNEIAGNPNEPELSLSDFNVPHRIVASVTYSKAYAKHFKTAVSVIYTGQSGAPYNITYYGDLNNDGSNGNDLIFIPTDEQIDQMAFSTYKTEKTADQQRSALKQFLGSAQYLKNHRGEYYERNCDNMDFEHHFDVRILQDFSFKTGNRTHTFQLSFDVMNIGNMFNKNWGKETFLANNSYSPINCTYNKNNQKMEFQYTNDGDYDPFSISDIKSRWRGQLGIKYIF